MGWIVIFLRTHPWQRRLLTASLTVIAAAAAGLWAYPYVRQRLVLRDLRSGDAEARRQAARSAVDIANSSPAFVCRLEAALETAGDDEFLAIADVLMRVGKFYEPQRRPIDVDRLHAHEMAVACAELGEANGTLRRQELLRQATFNRRDNVFVRQILVSVAGDEWFRMREAAAALAAIIGDDETLSPLLGDADARVASAAALCAGVAGRGALSGRIMEMLSGGDVEKVSSAAYAAALLRPAEAAEKICRLLSETADSRIRDRLLHAVVLLDDERPRQAVWKMLDAARRAGRCPPAMSLLAALRLEPTAAEKEKLVGDVREILGGRRGDALRAEFALAALTAARRLEADVLAELIDLCERAPRPYEAERLWRDVAALMGSQALRRAEDDPQRKRAVSCLKAIASYYDEKVTAPPRTLTMPVASASAAAALWKLHADKADQFVRAVARGGGAPAVDYLAWHVGLGGGARAAELAFSMLPAYDAPVAQKVFNDDERAAGAMIMALAAETPEQRAAAAARITERLIGGRAGGEDEPRVINMYRSALAALGQQDVLPHLQEAFVRAPRRRALVGLLLAGDRWALDWMLWGPVSEREIDYMLTDEAAAEVLALAVPALGGIDDIGWPELRLWQIRIMRFSYVINRPEITLGPR